MPTFTSGAVYPILQELRNLVTALVLHVDESGDKELISIAEDLAKRLRWLDEMIRDEE